VKDHRFRFVIGDGALSVESTDANGAMNLADWMTKVFAKEGSSWDTVKRDMILRPTNLSPGIHRLYQSRPLDSTVVVLYRGEAYQQIFCDPGETDKLTQADDLIFRDVTPIGIEKEMVSDAPRGLSDPELLALVAFVNAGVAEAQVANADRARKEEAPAYGENWFAPGVVELERELKRRGVLPS
jgi:hypothetical protein